jgi:hypothetical protein
MWRTGQSLPNAIRLTTAKYYTPTDAPFTNRIKRYFHSRHKRVPGELLMHGMIGDPSYIEPGHEGEAEPVEPLEKETAPSATPRQAAPVEPETPGDPAATPTPIRSFTSSACPKPRRSRRKRKKRKSRSTMSCWSRRSAR